MKKPTLVSLVLLSLASCAKEELLPPSTQTPNGQGVYTSSTPDSLRWKLTFNVPSYNVSLNNVLPKEIYRIVENVGSTEVQHGTCFVYREGSTMIMIDYYWNERTITQNVRITGDIEGHGFIMEELGMINICNVEQNVPMTYTFMDSKGVIRSPY